MIERVRQEGKVDDSAIDVYLVHQATHKLLEELRNEMQLDEQRMPTVLRDFGNTVSCTIPILIDELRTSGRVRPGTRTLLAGFGVGFSWAGCLWTETWENKAVLPADLEAA
jgi:3-oxoacyl-[acyl-carrier-protein] synthase-3